MTGTHSSTILKKAFDKITSEYERLDLPIPNVRKFGIHPGWNAVIGSHGCSGIAMSFQDNNPLYDRDQTEQDVKELQKKIGLSLFDVAEATISDPHLSHRSIGVAALNALSQPLVSDELLQKKGYLIEVDVKRLVKPDDIMAMVGYGGMVKSYAGRCRELHVTDQRPVEAFRTTIVDDAIRFGPAGIIVHPADENREVLNDADVVLITGSTLVNNTFDEVVGYAKNARIRAIYGSSAQLIPDVLFENGINIVMSVAIQDPQRFEYDVMNAPDMETAIRKHQKKYNVSIGGDILF